MSAHSKKSYILHIDGDNFFASCELLRFPHLRHCPVVVGRDRGIAVAFNSHAKKLGIVRAMPIHHIQKQFPQVTILSSHFELYKTISHRLVVIARRYMDTVSLYSIDEVFCGVSTDDVLGLAKKLQQEVYTKLGITVSIGISQTKVLAKLATSVQKPNGITHITIENRRDILSRIPIEDVWGIGGRTASKWRRRGIHTARDFADIEEAVIQREHAPVRELYHELRGVSLMKLGGDGTEERQQSFQSTESFPKSGERAFLFSEISRHCEILGARLYASGQELGSVHIYLKDEFGNYYSQSSAVSSSSQTDKNTLTSHNSTMQILNTIEMLFDGLYNPKYLYKSTGVTFSIAKPKKCKDVPNTMQASLFGGFSSTDTASEVLGGSSLSEGVREQNEPRVSTSLEVLKAAVRAKNGHSSIYTGSSGLSLHRKADKRRILAKTDHYIYGLPLPYLGIAR
jgi:nucleotidyltransferase/DNA polymerase involved in DNA repair